MSELTSERPSRSAADEPAPTGARDGASPPVLWHLKVSNYNEKARWALDYKGIPHVRRPAVPGAHTKIAEKLTAGRGSTFPILILDGEVIGDSTRIIEALERRHPDPPLYPADAQERRRVLELEEFFDEELGPHVRLLAIDHMIADRDLFLRAFVPDAGHARRLLARLAFARVRRTVKATMGIDGGSVVRAYAKVRAAGERFAAELRPSGYLSRDGFTVADLTLAALVAPAVAPEQFPYPQPQRDHPLLVPLCDALAQSGIVEFTRRMYLRHRGKSAEVPSTRG